MHNGKQLNPLEAENARLRDILNRSGGGHIPLIQSELARVQHEHGNYLQAANAERARVESQLQSARAELDKLERLVNERNQDLHNIRSIYENITEFVDSGLVNYEHPAYSSLALQNQLRRIRDEVKAMVRNRSAATAMSNFYFNNSAKEGSDFVRDMSKLLLRAYNAEAENCVKTVRAGNLPAAQKRLERTRAQVEKLGKMINLQITIRYHQLRMEELRLAALHLETKKTEKEAERYRRARDREEAKAQKEFGAQRAQLDKERNHLENVLARLREQGKSEEATDIEEKLGKVREALTDVDYRAGNAQAGYVYVISNVGAFGNGVVKIGMTRRLDPMDRVRELGDASVPFNFDVHAMFFSDDAVGLEAELHRRFSTERLNKVNLRREYFRVSPARVKHELEQIGGNLLEFVEEAEAEQYHLSIQIARQNPAYATPHRR